MKIEQVIKEVESLRYEFVDFLDESTLLFKGKNDIELEVWLDEKLIKKINTEYEPIPLTKKEKILERKLQSL